MGTKRAHSDIHPSRREQVPQASRKRQKPDNLGSKSFKKAHPINELKNRVRNLGRLLSREDDNLPAHIRIGKERELQSARHELRETQAAERRSKLIARYHMIRFFDRQKATKRLKKAKKELNNLAEDAPSSEVMRRRHDVEEAQLDVNYAMYYPLDKPYHSLFPKEHDDLADEGSRGDLEMRGLVSDCMINGKLDDLRSGKLTASAQQEEEDEVVPSDKKSTKKMIGTKHGPRSKQIEAQTTKDDDDASDGGFFE